LSNLVSTVFVAMPAEEAMRGYVALVDELREREAVTA
jgi:hypothetical protein